MKNTKIEWADHTINFWWGCTKVSPACANCYAETMAKRMGRKVFGEEVEWGAGKPRAERLVKAFDEALAIQRGAAKFASKNGRRPRVFVNSMSDWLDDEVPIQMLSGLLESLHFCSEVDFMLLTKRPENWESRIRKAIIDEEEEILGHLQENLPETRTIRFLNAWLGGVAPPNIFIGVTVENQDCAEARIPALLQIPAKVRFLSCEPLLGSVSFRAIQPLMEAFNRSPYGWHNWLRRRLHWVIAGGESGPGARPSHPQWLYDLRDQCQTTGVPFFFKQWGEWLPCGPEAKHLPSNGKYKHTLAIQEKGISERNADMIRVGTKAAGRMLQGCEWNEFPNVEGGAV